MRNGVLQGDTEADYTSGLIWAIENMFYGTRFPVIYETQPLKLSISLLPGVLRRLSATAFLVLFPIPTRTGIITSDFRSDPASHIAHY